jgi:hypothetical protein
VDIARTLEPQGRWSDLEPEVRIELTTYRLQDGKSA